MGPRDRFGAQNDIKKTEKMKKTTLSIQGSPKPTKELFRGYFGTILRSFLINFRTLFGPFGVIFVNPPKFFAKSS